MLFKDSTAIVGNTPLIELTHIEEEFSLKCHLFAKVEYFNPTGSVKDRAALYMINDALDRGLLNDDTIIIEPTSGNTGIGIASICAMKGYRCILVMPESMSIERRKLLKAYGAEIVLSDASLGMKGAIAKANELHEQNPNSIILGQFDNFANVRAHYETTGPEIFSDLGGRIDAFVAGIGTGGTISGTGKYLKEMINDVKVIGVEPANSPVISKGRSGKHAIQGIGAGFIPKILDLDIIDEMTTVSDEDALECARLVGSLEGLLVGISSGAALASAIKVCEREEFEGKNVVVLFPDSGDRYLSTSLFEK